MLAQSIFARRDGESIEDHETRKAGIERVFRNALSGQAGHELIQLLLAHRNPVHPRFAPGRTTEQAAFIDGQCDVISTLMLYGTNLGLSKPDEQQQ
jgi:hypothetical protein